jgi:hypothetical protein
MKALIKVYFFDTAVVLIALLLALYATSLIVIATCVWL